MTVSNPVHYITQPMHILKFSFLVNFHDMKIGIGHGDYIAAILEAVQSGLKLKLPIYIAILN